MDAIRTAGDSEATITLNDGTRISLEDNTMIVLNFTEDQPAIDFGYGSMQAEATGDSDLEINSGDSTINLSDSEARISGSEGDLELQVQKGEARLKKGDEEKTVGENEIAGMDANQVRVEKNPLSLISPADQSRFYTRQSREAVNFQWKSDGPVTLQVASDRGFSSIVAQAPRGDGNASAAIGPGIYYWRVLKNGQASPIRRFAVYQEQSPVLQMPLGGSEFTYRDSPPPVQFLWSRLDGVTSYRIVVSQSQNLSNPIINEQLVVNSITRNLSPGTYYWQIQPISSAEASVSSSGIGSFSVSQQDNVSAPIPLSPVNSTFVQALLEKNGLTFSWKQDSEIRSVNFQLAADGNFQNVLTSSTVGSNVFRYTGSLEPGTYYWRLTGEGFNSSRIAQFQIAEKERLQTVLPAPGSSLTSLQQDVQVRFAWKGPAGNYRLLVSNNANLEGARTASTSDRSAIVPGLDQGTFFWKVQRLSSDGDVLGESAILNFKIERKLDKPDLIYPVPGSTVDMTELDKIVFRWKPVEGARSYTIKLYIMDGTGQRQLITRNVVGTQFQFDDLSQLDTALFRYTVEANAPGLDGEPAQAAFRISLQLDKKPEFITPEVIFK
ncbi:MAG: FecR family protein [Leptospiraceae bacterium]